MELRNVLNQLKSASGAGMQKTASAETPKTSAAQNELYRALNTALSAADKTAAAQTKTASATDELTKIAQNLATADQEALVKEAQLYGACIMDGFVARGMQYNNAFGQTEKTAASEQEELAAWARANPQQFQKHAAAGYANTHAANAPSPEYAGAVAHFQKLASTTPDGYEKLAAFQQGYADTVAQLNAIASEPGGQEKLAAMQQGYAEGTALVTKLADDYYARGYNDTVKILQNM